MSSGTTVTTRFRVTALPSKDLNRLRSRGVDDFGNKLVVQTNQGERGIPLRCCLRDADPGERFMLIAWQPAHVGGPYAEVGPVFVHADLWMSRHAGFPTVAPSSSRSTNAWP